MQDTKIKQEVTQCLKLEEKILKDKDEKTPSDESKNP